MRKYLLALAVLAGLISPARAVDTTVSAMTAAGALDGTELLYCVQAGADRKCTPAQINTYVLSLMGAGVGTFLGTPSSANLRAALTDETGTGLAYFQGGALGTPASGTLTNATGLPVATGISGLGTGIATALGVNVGTAGAPVINGGALGTPSSGTLTNATGLPISTGVSGLGAGIASWLATPSSANLATALTDETGSGAAVFGTSPTITSPTIATGMTMSFLAGGGTQCVTVSNTGVIAAAACGSGSGTVTQIDTACGVTGGPITTTGTVSGAAVIRAHTGTTDTILSSDCGKIVTASNAGAVAVTLPQATGSFGDPFFFTQVNLGAGTVTITPTTSTINGAATLVLTTGQSADIASDGTNYVAALGKSGGSGTVTTTGSPASGNLARFSGATSITNDDLSGDCTTSGTLAVKCQPLYPKYIASNWYNGGGDRFTGLSSNSTAGGATGRLNCYPGYFYGTATISNLGFRINTTSAGGNIQAGIYANNAATMRPTGTPLVSTASMSTATGTTVSAAASVQITGSQIVWWCSNQDNSTATAFALTSGNFQIANLVGSTTQAAMIGAGPAAFAGVTTAKAFGTWDDVSAATWSESGNSFPIVQFQISSVP